MKARLPLIAGGALALLLLGAGARYAAGGWQPSLASYRFQGIDVGAAEAPFDWPVVREQGVVFAYLIAVRGTDREPGFEENWHALYENAIGRGAVQVYSLCRLAIDQGNGFNTLVPRSSDALPPAILLDLSADCTARPDRAVVIGEIKRLIALIEAHSGKRVLLKISRQFETAYQISMAIDRPLWVIGDFFPPDYGARPWRLWQAHSFRRVAGVTGAARWSVVAP